VDPMISGAITAFGVIASAFLTYKASNRKLKTDSGQQLIDQHQEDIAALRSRVGQLERTQRIQGDYIGQLRLHIADGRPPPPPSWPEGLIT
jgi:hypothetical protein